MKRIQDLLRQDRPLTWLFYGDSITHGAVHTFGSRDYTELFAERIRTEMGRGMDVVIKSAIAGNTTRDLLQGLDWRVSRFGSDVVFIMIGMNDCAQGRQLHAAEFRRNLELLCQQIAAAGSLIVLQTTPPILAGTAPDREPRFPEYMEIVRGTAQSQGALLIDHTRYWQGQSDFADRHFYWMGNSFHPNAHGHVLLARYLFKCLGIFEPGSAMCRQFVPWVIEP